MVKLKKKLYCIIVFDWSVRLTGSEKSANFFIRNNRPFFLDYARTLRYVHGCIVFVENVNELTSTWGGGGAYPLFLGGFAARNFRAFRLFSNETALWKNILFHK